jgi:hypothetical protein
LAEVLVELFSGVEEVIECRAGLGDEGAVGVVGV